MAHLVKLGALTDGLVTVITNFTATNEPDKFNFHREEALRSLRNNQYLRTNQFEVQDGLAGLEEKYRVYDKDSLADALKERLTKLEERATKWTPEILHFLLELSDRPVANVRLSDLENLRPPPEPPQAPLLWKDLARQDPLLREKSIWKNVDFGAESSEDDDTSIDEFADDQSLSENTTLSSVNGDESRRLEEFMVHGDTSGLAEIRKSQFWVYDEEAAKVRDRFEVFPKKIVYVTELQAIREVLFMLRGVPTSLFKEDEAREGKPASNEDYVIEHLSPGIFRRLLAGFARDGWSINIIRRWNKAEQKVPLLQGFSAEVSSRLQTFDKFLSVIESRFVAVEKNTVVSLVQLQKDLQPRLHVLFSITKVLQDLDSELYAHAFRHLELLYDQVCLSQMAGDDELYKFTGSLFLDCFKLYLRPIRYWMVEGTLSKEDNVFFITETAGVKDLASLWHNRYRLRVTSAGALHGPKFLETAASKIFTAGKTVVVLAQLGKSATFDGSKVIVEPSLDFRTVCGNATTLNPFSELFRVAFSNWVQSKYHASSSVLRESLFKEYGLMEYLDLLKRLFFMSDGASASTFTNVVFERLDRGGSTWSDPFILTELMRNAVFTGKPSRKKAFAVGPDRLRISNLPAKKAQKSLRSVEVLEIISVSMRTPWPISLLEKSKPQYPQMFTFLLQIRRSSYVLEQARLIDDSANEDSSADERAMYYGLRSRLLWFTSTLYNYLTGIVIETSTSDMRASLIQAEDLDAMIEVYEKYLEIIKEQALLGSRLEPIRKAILKILNLSIYLSDARAVHISMQPSQSTNPDKLAKLREAAGGFRSSIRSAMEDDGEESAAEMSFVSAIDAEMSYADHLKSIRDQFNRLHGFVAIGLRNVARAGGDAKWEVLAQMLEYGHTVSS